jgi:multiple antibiotic resistance protein
MLTQTMRVIMTRIMGMILIAISVEMFVAGLKALLPGLG